MVAGLLVEYPAVSLLTMCESCPQSEIGTTVGRLYGAIGMANPDLEMTGMPRIYYHGGDASLWNIEAAIPVSPESVAGEGSTRVDYPAGHALMASYFGPYEGLGQAWAELWEQVNQKGLTPEGPCWDDYVTDPGSEPDSSKWQTDIYISIKLDSLI